MQLFAFRVAILNQKLEETREMLCESTTTADGYRNWSHATKMDRGFFKHAGSKYYLACDSTWKEKIKQPKMDEKITSLVNKEAIERNLYSFS